MVKHGWYKGYDETGNIIDEDTYREGSCVENCEWRQTFGEGLGQSVQQTVDGGFIVTSTQQLRTQLAQWFRKQGAIVHSAQGEKEWEQMREKLELDMVILDRPKRGVTTGGISLN